jgi:multidrug efflux system membrane fusion protein
MNDALPPEVEAPNTARANAAWRVHWRPVLAALIVIAIVASGVVWYLSRTPGNAPAGKGRGGANGPLPVVAAAARKGNIDVYINALGTVTPRNMVVVHTRVDGQLMNVAFREGQNVKAGDLLAQLDPRPFEVQLTQAEGTMAHDQALLQNARIDLERYRTLLKQDSIASQQVDTQEALVRQDEGQVKSDQGAIDNAKLQLVYTRVTSPITGRVGLRLVDPGNIVHAADANGLVTITQEQPTTVVYPVAEDDVPRVVKRMQSGQPVVVEASDRSGKIKLATGHLLTIDNQIDTTTGTVKLKAEFPNLDGALFPNQFVNVRMAVETRPDATLVPSAAIQRGAPGTFVFLVKSDQSVAVTPVKLGAIEGETTEVTSGLQPGDQVVVDGSDKLRDGSKVELADLNARRAAPANGARKGGAGADKAPGDQPRRGKGGG